MERCCNAVEMEDPDLVTDILKTKNNEGRPSDTFNAFWEKLKTYADEFGAADERRHGEGICHMAYFVSIR